MSIKFIDDSNEEIDLLEDTSSAKTLPIGFETLFFGNTAPTNWLISDGSAVSRIIYKELFSLIGTTYGEGDGSTTFNLPNRVGKIPVGLDTNDTNFNTINKEVGENTVILDDTKIPSHNHEIPVISGSISYSDKHQHTYADRYRSTTTFANDLNLNTLGGTGATARNGTTGSDGNHYHNVSTEASTTDEQGSSQGHNNLQPYILCNYIIKAK